MSRVENLIRPHLKQLVGYTCARDDFNGAATDFMDANENAWAVANSPLL